MSWVGRGWDKHCVWGYGCMYAFVYERIDGVCIDDLCVCTPIIL